MARDPLFRQLMRPGGALLLSAAGPALGAIVVLGMAYAHAQSLREGGMGIGVMLLLGGALAVGLVLLPTHVLSLLCGWSLGLAVGLPVAVAAVTLGAPLGYVLGRLLAGPGLVQTIERNPRGAAVCSAITRASPLRAAWLVGLLRLSPVVPYGSTNVLAAVFAVPVIPYLLGTFVGLAPRVAVVVALGAGLEQLDGEQQASHWLWGVGIAATLLAVVLMGVYAKRALARLAAEENNDSKSLTADDA